MSTGLQLGAIRALRFRTPASFTLIRRRYHYDGAVFHHFTEQTEVLHSQLHDALFGSVFTRSQLSKSDYDRLPAFAYRRNPLPVSIIAYYLFLIAISACLYKIAQNRLQKAFQR